MKALLTTLLFLCFVFTKQAPFRERARENHQLAEDLHSRLRMIQTDKEARISVLRDEVADELGRESLAYERERIRPHSTSALESEEYRLIKKAAKAVVRRLALPSPPRLHVLIDKAAQFVMKKTLVLEYGKVKSGIRELVDRMLIAIAHEKEEPIMILVPTTNEPQVTQVRIDKLLLAMEELLQEIIQHCNLTTLQAKRVIRVAIKVLTKQLKLSPGKKEELAERVMSHMRARLEMEDEDNKDARLRRLEERIEGDIERYHLSAQQLTRLEALSVEEEALKEHLSKQEKVRMLKRMYADVIDDLRAQRKEEKAGSPTLTVTSVIAITNMINEKAIEMRLTPRELQLLKRIILTALKELANHTSQPPSTQGVRTTGEITTRRADLVTESTTSTRESVGSTSESTRQKTTRETHHSTLTSFKTTELDALSREEETEETRTTLPTTRHMTSSEIARHPSSSAHAPTKYVFQSTKQTEEPDELEKEELVNTVSPTATPMTSRQTAESSEVTATISEPTKAGQRTEGNTQAPATESVRSTMTAKSEEVPLTQPVSGTEKGTESSTAHASAVTLRSSEITTVTRGVHEVRLDGKANEEKKLTEKLAADEMELESKVPETLTKRTKEKLERRKTIDELEEELELELKREEELLRLKSTTAAETTRAVTELLLRNVTAVTHFTQKHITKEITARPVTEKQEKHELEATHVMEVTKSTKRVTQETTATTVTENQDKDELEAELQVTESRKKNEPTVGHSTEVTHVMEVTQSKRVTQEPTTGHFMKVTHSTKRVTPRETTPKPLTEQQEADELKSEDDEMVLRKQAVKHEVTQSTLRPVTQEKTITPVSERKETEELTQISVTESTVHDFSEVTQPTLKHVTQSTFNRVTQTTAEKPDKEREEELVRALRMNDAQEKIHSRMNHEMVTDELELQDLNHESSDNSFKITDKTAMRQHEGTKDKRILEAEGLKLTEELQLELQQKQTHRQENSRKISYDEEENDLYNMEEKQLKDDLANALQRKPAPHNKASSDESSLEEELKELGG